MTPVEAPKQFVLAVHMDAGDFECLPKDSGPRYPGITPDRFKAPPGCEVNAEWEWTRIYWFGEDFASLILARAFFATVGYGFETLYDKCDPHDEGALGWCLLTNYDPRAAP